MEKNIDRRCFLKAGALIGAGALASSIAPRMSWASSTHFTPAKFSDVVDMDQITMAEQSGLVMDSWRYLQETVQGIKNPAIKKTVQDILKNPAPTFMGRMGDKERKHAYDQLLSLGLIEDIELKHFLPPTQESSISPQPFYSAPGSGYSSHHAYPGGVVTHTALNVHVALSIYDGYRNTYDYLLDRDVIVASQVLHDLHKPWVFPWQNNGASRDEQKLAGTGEHHPLSVAESMYRGLPAKLCVAQACAHNHPGFAQEEEGPVNWIKTASILLGKDPVQEGLLHNDGKSLPQPRTMENFICHLADHDWVLSVPAAKWTIPLMEKIAVKHYNINDSELQSRKFNQLRNYVFAQASIMSLYELYVSQGFDALSETVLSIVKPA